MEHSFNSIERFLELGLGMGLARQMMGTMNQIMANAPVSGTANSTPETQYYAVVDNLQVGPLSESEAESLIQKGKITTSTLIWKVGTTSWKTAESIPEIYKLIILNT